jgi:hypothetical protein
VRVLLLVVLIVAVAYFAPTKLTKDNLVILVVALLTTIGLVRVLVHETRSAATELYPTLTEIVDSHYAFKRHLRELQAQERGETAAVGTPARAPR